ncbi:MULTISPECIES: ATP-grasp fold amidoligase family protein [Proteus]|uniref:ATP-grasp fold amidoligase family protein n=1 Tax=Proteus TaxID=583 RepID=UPI000D697A60|nr:MULTISPECIES: ATP-grasp fold amidoligase family protein [Proteus]MCO8051281.1 glycosyltransferase [Proteus penneri]NBL90164.1 glycosyltransferase [Proteus sp. G2673]NBM01540.1 glycosyltransferase [Proteus sp. G2671]NBM11150.1 glycosyltransferase [Proteus sp. G2670]NBM32717.1 glycosyltransferase [Proteus sp. G2664]
MKIIEYYFKLFRTIVLPDRVYLKNKFIRNLGYQPNFKIPTSLNEKINARMLFDRNPIYTRLADKIKVRDYVIEKIGPHYLVPIINTYSHPDEIDITQLPSRFVLKCNHDSGSTIICLDKATFDIEKAKKKLQFHLKRNLYPVTREWHYKNINAQIICEEYIDLFDTQNPMIPTTCRLHCFNGQPHYAEIDISDTKGNGYINVYDTNWQLQPITLEDPNTPKLIEKPTQFEIMLQLAAKLANGFNYCRVDFLMSENRLIFSEMTFTPNAGRIPIKPKEWDYKLGALWS